MTGGAGITTLGNASDVTDDGLKNATAPKSLASSAVDPDE